MRVEQFRPSIGAVDCFRTYFQYTDAILDYMAEHPNERGNPSVAGYDGLVFTHRLPIDFDDEADPRAALAGARRFVTNFAATYDVPPAALAIAFSGCKGFSIEVPMSLFGGFVPGVHNAWALRRLAWMLLEGHQTADLDIYDSVRLWRVENSVNSKSGLYKIPLTARQLRTLDLDGIRNLATAPQTVNRESDDEWTAQPDLVALWEAATLERAEGHSSTGAEGGRTFGEAEINGFVDLMRSLYRDGMRHRFCLAFAGWCAKQLIAEATTKHLIEVLAADAADDDLQDRREAVATSYAKYRLNAENVRGWWGMKDLGIPDTTLRKLEQLLDNRDRAKATGTNGHRSEEEANAAQTETTRRRPQIDAGNKDLEETSGFAWAALKYANVPPFLFRFGRTMVRIEGGEDGSVPVAQTLNEDRLRHQLARSADWIKCTERDGVKAAAPPLDVVRDMLAAPEYPLPPLTSIVQTPVFAPDGTLQTERGYCSAGKTFYVPAPGFTVPPVSPTPTADEIARAKATILDDLVVDFPFLSRAERANAIALFLDYYVRNLIDGPTPLRMIEAPKPGSGKGLLADAVLRPAVGQRVSVMPAPTDDDEWRKRITAQLMLMPAAILIDNVTDALDSGSLSSALTALWWTDRRLGANEMVHIPVRALWLCTANNPTMSTELARRTVRIRLDAKVDRPWQRTEFKHEDLRTWIDEHRGDLVWSALTLIQHWIAEGMPLGTVKIGSFERWAAVLGGILGVAGIDGFLGNLEAFYEASDLEGAIWRQFVAIWFEKFGEGEVGVADLFHLALTVDGLDLGKGNERAQKTSFGVQLNKHRDQVIGEYRIAFTREVQRVKRWRLIRARPGENPFDAFYSDPEGDE
jgi:hypothetical protein